MAFRTRERRNNAAIEMLHNDPPVRNQAWLTTQQEVTADPLGAIWMTPLTYQQALADTPFDPRQLRAPKHYRRDGQRERLVEERIVKRRLLYD
jgi:hypothetical protein